MSVMNPTVKKPGKTERGDFAAPSCDTPYGRLYARLKAACVRGIVGTIAIRNIGSKETSDDKDHMTNPKVENAQYSEEDIAKYRCILLTRNNSKQLEISRKAVLG